MPPAFMTKWPVVKVVLILLNLLATWLTIVVKLKDSPLVAWAAGQHDTMRQRLLLGTINRDIVETTNFKIQDLPTPMQLADYTFLSTPRRSTQNIGEARSMCPNINSISAPVMMLHYNDFWGRGARRAQIFYHSISAPYCQVLNVKPDWRDECVTARQGNATLCYQYVLDNFDTLRKDDSIRMGVVRDVGAPGVPFLRCVNRPLVPFKFKADLLGHQTYWSGGDYHVTIRTSDCNGIPLVMSNDRVYSLFQTVNVDDACDMVVLLPPSGRFVTFISWFYSFLTILLVIDGIKQALFRTNTVNYLPHDLRIGKRRRWLRYAIPWMDAIIRLSDQDRSVITFKGAMLIASDLWMTHWLYIWFSILDAVVDLRATYVILQVAEYLLMFKWTIGNMIYLCGALVKVTWLMCLVQTVMRMVIKLGARCFRSVRLIRSKTREKIEWNVDGISILLSYRIYYVILLILTMALFGITGSPSFMVQDVPYTVGVFGGVEDIAGFWGSEVACDLITLLGILVIISLIVGIGLMHTKYKDVADNGLMRLLQSRYIVSGWDGLLAAQVFGLNPSDPNFYVDGRAHTQCSVGSLLQMLYLSGPSGLVHLAGDYIFHDNGFSKDPVRFHYPIPKALTMGLFSTGKGSEVSSGIPSAEIASIQIAQSNNSGAPGAVRRTKAELAAARVAKRSIFERRLRLVRESYLGKLLLIDASQSGQITTNKETGHREYEVIDALTTMTILDVKYLMGREKKIHVE